MIKIEVWKVAAIRNRHRDGIIKVPRFQRNIEPSRRLIQSMRDQARQHGSLPLPLVLWHDPKGVYWVIDWGTRLKVVLAPKFPERCEVPVTIYTDISYEQARATYSDLNRTAVKQSTGELIHAYEKDFPQTLRTFVKDPVWGMYLKRFKYLEHAVKLYFEAVGSPAYACDAILDRLTPEELPDDSLVDSSVLDRVLQDIGKSQSVLSRAAEELSGVARDAWWPVMWIFRAMQYEPSLRKRSIQQLADGFVSWKKSRTGKLDTSQPNRPKSEIDPNMQELVNLLNGLRVA